LPYAAASRQKLRRAWYPSAEVLAKAGSAPFVSARPDRSRTPDGAALRLPSRAQRCRVHRIPCPTFVTIMIRPSWGPGWGELVALICPTGQAEYFLRQVWTAQITLKLQRKIGSARTAFPCENGRAATRV
jgi:hypothetical protein